MIEWNKLTNRELRLINQIAKRAIPMAADIGHEISSHVLEMDIGAAHLVDAIDLEGLLGASDSDFVHDVFGIRRFMDRKTGKLTGHFSPRYSKKVPA